MQFINKQLFNIYCFFLINEIMKKTQRNRLDDEREGDTHSQSPIIQGGGGLEYETDNALKPINKH